MLSLLAALVLASPARSRLTGAGAGSTPPVDDAQIRRWEYVVLVRTSTERGPVIGHAETAALRAGAAVLDRVRMELGKSHADHRLLVRTRAPGTINAVLDGIRGVRGVLGASAVQLPETPTYAGGPDFMSSYTAALAVDDDPRVVVRHDLPPVLDKRDLLEQAPIPAGPGVGPEPLGGFTLNVSELYKRLRSAAWQRRERRLKEGYLPILPKDDEAPSADAPDQ